MKIYPNEIRQSLTKGLYDIPENEIKEVFSFLNFRLLEYGKEIFHTSVHSQERHVWFEIHHERMFVIKVRAGESNGMASFSNQFVDFGEMNSGIAMPVDSVGDLAQVVIGIFMHNMGLPYNSEFIWVEDDSQYTLAEATACVETLKELFSDYKSLPL